MGFGLILPIRIIQGLLALAVVGLSASVVHWYNATMVVASPSQLNFLIFGGIWSILSLVSIEAVPRFYPRASNPYIALGVEITNVLFWFSGFVALAVFLSKLLFCRGAVCHAAQVDAVFAALSFAIWTSSTVLLGRDLFKAGFRRPSAAGSAPAMKQTA
ncbi:hypothetical protein MFIFM68171_03221 [Madurella fahalii]|uniref:MARVEL domain-containing protein n=1 Tax=Madurella fahalii TaxID=1157608 RepID=A0ABQ0G5G5_9PEZI